MSKSLKRKRGEYNHYSAEQRYKMAKYAVENGDGLPCDKRGRPTLLGTFVEDVIDYIKSLRLSGGIVNRPIVIAAARAANGAVVQAMSKSLKRKRGEYNHYSAEQRYKMAKYAVENGDGLPCDKRGRPTLLGTFVEDDIDYIKSLRLSGGIVNRPIVIAAARAHQVNEFKDELTRNNFRMRYVPASCTSELQPLDLSGNDEFKKCIKNQFSEWYRDQIQKDLKR
uniref:DDE-1 domain-containing protein n=1 Tax=Magallana gigas TaxID=29159 RepID=A0A8W8KNW3_MAGGI